jgi:hypothetical protein
VPELIGATVELGPPSFGLAAPVLESSIFGGAGHLVADRHRAILRIGGVGTFAIADGRRVSIDPDPNAEEAAITVWLHGTVAALLLAQRGQFALHASVVDIGGVGVSVAGSRGAGKSTTALRLAQLGHRLVADDVSPLVIGEHVNVNPYTRPVHVFTETAEMLGVDLSDARPVLPAHAKLALPPEPRGPVTVSVIAILEPSDEAATVKTERVGGARMHWAIYRNIYRADVLHDLWHREMFAWAGAIAATVPVHVITRPGEGWTVDSVASAVERLAVGVSAAGR